MAFSPFGITQRGSFTVRPFVFNTKAVVDRQAEDLKIGRTLGKRVSDGRKAMSRGAFLYDVDAMYVCSYQKNLNSVSKLEKDQFANVKWILYSYVVVVKETVKTLFYFSGSG